MIEVHAEFPQREVIQANAVVDNEEKTVSEVIISAKPEITGVTASVDNETGIPYVDVTETGTGTEYSFDLAFHNLKGDKGDTGATGATGQDGFSPSVTVEQTETGATITATDKDGTTSANLYNGADGQDGADGQAATITVGSTTTGQAGTNASVVNSGTSSAAILDFTIPKGDKGVAGVSVTGVSLISTSGLQKTYRMTFSNNTYYDYIVTDGAAGDTSWGAISGTLSNQTDLQTELTGLQTQIDALVVSSDVFDVVGTYADLQAYDISTVPVNDIIKVLVDSAHSNAATYYRCVEVSNVKSWSYIGTEGAYYTKSETDTLLNTKYDDSNPNGYTSNVGTVTSVNNVLPDANGNVTLSIPTVNNGVLTITQNGTSKGTFSANQSSNDTIALTDTTYSNFTGADGTNAGSSGLVPAPSATDNDKYLKGDGTWASVSGGSSTDVQINGTSITSGGVANILTESAYSASNKIATMSDVPSTSGLANTDLSNLSATGEAHFLKSIDSTDVINALGYTPQNSLTAVTHNANTQMGSGVNPIYVSSTGQVFSSGSTVGSGVKPVFLNAGAITVSASTVGGSSTPVYLNAGTITSTGLSIASSRFDGQWVAKYLDVASNTAINSYTHSLSTYLPNDSQAYEIFVRIGCYTTTGSSGGTGNLAVGTISSPDTNNNSGYSISLRVSTNSTQARAAIILPIASNVRNFYSQISEHKMANTFIVLYGYRRIGTNT